jgi:phenylpropionate dioxygenase-like ring-hydroxylating dioxygenase large terminal subunit
MTETFRLPREAYTEQAWFERELETLFIDTWRFIGTTNDFKEAGDYRTLRVGRAPLAVIRDGQGELRAFHNVCRHRGAELLDGDSGNAGKVLVCPYHRWTFGLDGALRGVPDRPTCFPDLDRSSLGLKPAAMGILKGLIFVNPNPGADFDAWVAPLAGREWPHDLFDSDVKEAAPLLYDLKCNWKVFAENAIDGYHLAYLHEKTLGGPAPDKNVWEQAGDHMIWYANEDGVRHRLPAKIREETGTMGMIKSARETGYGGVYFLFPATLIVPTPFGLSLSILHPVAPGRTRMTVRQWIGPWQWRDERNYIQGYDKKTGIISSDNWTKHPLETGDFQTEDVWICEKVQRGLESPAYEHGPLSQGAGAEDPIRWFHGSLKRAMPAS